MSDPPPKDTQLHESAPKGLSIVPESEWTDYDKTIWDQFDELSDGIWRGEPPSHGKMAIGRLDGNPVLITRTEHADGLDEMRLWEPGKFSHTLVVHGNVFLYPKNPSEDNVTVFDEWIEIYSTILEGDGEYDLFRDSIPEEYIWCLSEMFQDQEPADIRQYICDQVGSVEEIVDPKVKEHFKILFASASKDCPYCQKHVGEDCKHLLAYLDLTFRQFLAGRAEELFSRVHEGEEGEFDERFDSFDEACGQSADHSENCNVESGPGDSSEESIHWAEYRGKAIKKLAQLLSAK